MQPRPYATAKELRHLLCMRTCHGKNGPGKYGPACARSQLNLRGLGLGLGLWLGLQIGLGLGLGLWLASSRARARAWECV